MDDGSHHPDQTMENQTQFDLNEAIRRWRTNLEASPNLTPENISELEIHLRDSAAKLHTQGISEEEAFSLAVHRLGRGDQLDREYQKVNLKIQHASDWNRPLAFVAWALFAVSFLMPSYAALPGYQCALAQTLFWSQAIRGEWSAIHYLLLTLPNLLMIASPFLLRRFTRDPRSLWWVRYSSFAATGLVWSFLVLLLAHEERADLRVGSYVWAASFSFFSASTIWRRSMNKPLQKLLGVMGIGLGWGVVWAAFFVTIGLIIGILRPQDIGPGEGLLVASGIGLLVGFVSGSVFGMILSFADHRKAMLDLPLIRVAIWGMLGAAVWPLLTPLPNSMLIILCPLGAGCASASVAIARSAVLHDLNRPPLLKWIGRLFRNPLQAACASNG